MNIPEFTAEASLYRTSGRYRASVSAKGDLPSGESIILAYFPGPATQAVCDTCLKKAVRDHVICLGLAGGACLASGPFYPLCFGAAAASCWAKLGWDVGECVIDDCCPKLCGGINPFAPGKGCCDENETCVDRYDPNSRGGCCPSDQIVCGGKCCAKGESCCGETCCPAGYFCRGGWICEREFIGSFPTTPPPPPVNNCIFGGAPCGNKCCPPGLVCCGVYGGQPDCKTSCVR